MADTARLRRWQSHKIVHAGKIVGIDGDMIEIELADGQSDVVKAAPNMFSRYMPVPGDYYTVYEDGYAAISPRQAFEDGYHAL